MGFTTIIGSTKESVIKDRIRTKESGNITWKVLAHSLRGNNLWSVVERIEKGDGFTKTIRYIALDLIGYDRYNQSWGYKDLSESMGPVHYNCPLKFLNMVPQPCDSENTATWASNWRNKVRDWHTSSAKRRKEMLEDPMEEGDKWMLRDGLVDRATRQQKLTHVYITKVYPRFVHAIANDGCDYKVPKKYLLRRMGEKEVSAEEFLSI